LIKVLAIPNFKEEKNILIATKQGMMKQAKLQDFEVTRYNKPIRAMRLADDDEVISVDINEKANILAVSMKGYALRFKSDELPLYGLQAGGVKSMSLQDGDEVAGARYVKPGDDFIILTNRGHIIKDVVEELPLYNRNRRGILIIEHQKANPHLAVSIARLSRQQQKENVGVLIITEKGSLSCTVNDLKYSGNKFGKKIFEEADLGRGYLIDIFEALEEKDEPKREKIIKKQTIDPVDPIDLVKEEIIELKDKKIHLNRLDLFDEDE
jgi:topoisomerase-4 subunit A